VVLHLIPPFRSQHVPTRFTYPAFLLMSVVAAHVVERRAGGWRARWSANAFDATVVFLLTASAASIGLEDARSVRPWFSLRVPPVTERTDGFRQYAEVPPELSYGDGDHNSAGGINGAPGLLVRQANVGAMRCSTAPGLTHDAHLGPDGRPIHMGARGLGDPLYRGEFWADNGRVTLVRWSPDEVVLAVEGAKPGDEIMLNQNWAAGWSANDEPTINRSDINAHRLKEGTETVTFRYRPRTLPAALGFFAVGALGWPAAWLLWSRRRRTPRRPGRDDRWPLDLLRAALGRRRAFRGPDAAIPT
jgi:hypothetical protein